MRGWGISFAVGTFVICALAVGTVTQSGFAESPSSRPAAEQFFRANQKYAAGDYQGAVLLYEAMREDDFASGPLYYNLGNAYFKLGRLGRSILNYERSRRLMGQDEDLLANLSYVRSLREQEQPREAYAWYEWMRVAPRDLFSATYWALVLLVIYHLFFGAWLLAIWVERVRQRALPFVWGFFVLTLVSLFFASAKIRAEETKREGIVVQRIADVRYSPSPQGAVAFQLREGIQADIDQCEAGWCHIRLTRDKSGWVASGAIEAI